MDAACVIANGAEPVLRGAFAELLAIRTIGADLVRLHAFSKLRHATAVITAHLRLGAVKIAVCHTCFPRIPDPAYEHFSAFGSTLAIFRAHRRLDAIGVAIHGALAALGRAPTVFPAHRCLGAVGVAARDAVVALGCALAIFSAHLRLGAIGVATRDALGVLVCAQARRRANFGLGAIFVAVCDAIGMVRTRLPLRRVTSITLYRDKSTCVTLISNAHSVMRALE